MTRTELDLPNAAYHSDPAISSSTLKAILDSPAKYHHSRTTPREPSTAMDFGTVVHSIVLGTPSEYVEVDADSWRTKAARERAEEIREEGRTPVLPRDLAPARACAKSVLDHPVAGPLFTGEGISEASIWGRDETTGLDLRIRPDRLATLPDGRALMVDLKTARDASPREFSRAAWTYRYYLQQAFYQRVYCQATGLEDVPFVFVVAESAAPYQVAIYQLTDNARRMGKQAMRRALDLYVECEASGIWPGYPEQPQPLDLPAWADFDHEKEMSA